MLCGMVALLKIFNNNTNEHELAYPCPKYHTQVKGINSECSRDNNTDEPVSSDGEGY